MSKKQRRQSGQNIPARQQQPTPQERRKATFVRWGILAMIGGVLLFSIDMLFLYISYLPSHPEVARNISSALSILQGPLIIEGALLLLGIGALIYGLYPPIHK